MTGQLRTTCTCLLGAEALFCLSGLVYGITVRGEGSAPAKLIRTTLVLLTPRHSFGLTDMMMHRFWLGAFALLALLSNTSAQRISSNPTVTLTGNLTIHGVSNSTGTEAFRGIPFAAAPVRNLRYAAPSPVPVTAPTVINASAFGPVCMQPPSVSPPLLSVGLSCQWMLTESYSFRISSHWPICRRIACP